MDKFQREFGCRVRELREQLALSQDRLAVNADMHKNYLGAIERGHYNVSLRTARKLADALGVPLATLVEAEPAARRLSEADRLRQSILKLLQRQNASKLRTILNVVKELTKSRS